MTEDYIAAKLGRADRSTTDLQDVLQVFVQNKDEVDFKYLGLRLRRANLLRDLVELVESENVAQRLAGEFPALLEWVESVRGRSGT
ncbi:MAG: hypothetical protein ACTSU5_02485 [Promethearchaeota archaeon]